MVTFGHLMQHFKESKEKIKIQSHPAPINIIVWVKAGSVPTVHVPNTMLMTFWEKWVNIYTVLWEKVTWKPFDRTWICNFSFVSLNTKKLQPQFGCVCKRFSSLVFMEEIISDI